jgi:hypothetical protein
MMIIRNRDITPFTLIEFKSINELKDEFRNISEIMKQMYGTTVDNKIETMVLLSCNLHSRIVNIPATIKRTANVRLENILLALINSRIMLA